MEPAVKTARMRCLVVVVAVSLAYMLQVVGAKDDGSSACNLSKDVGPCRSFVAITRYFWDGKTNSCKQFGYGGCKGNANNFKTEKECNKKCGASKKEPKTKENCDGPSVCNKPKDRGPCRAYGWRIYWDSKTKSCKVFAYGGCGGNGNNFKSAKECNEKCGSSNSGQTNTGNSVCKLPKVVGPCRAAHTRYYFDYKDQICTQFTYGGCGGNGNNFKSPRECNEKCRSSYSGQPNTGNSICKLPKVVGLCKAWHPSFYYDSKTNSCKHFIYGGCGGNGNRFYGTKECMEKCGSSNSGQTNTGNSVCKLPKVVGPCRAAHTRYYFDYKDSVCTQFTYGGCGGNGNNFKSPRECDEKCRPIYRRPNTGNSICKLAKVAGHCFAAFRRFYFDSKTNSCQKFTYGGCGGNKNNFRTETQCLKACKPKSTRPTNAFTTPPPHWRPMIVS